jgi:hypothetical protein
MIREDPLSSPHPHPMSQPSLTDSNRSNPAPSPCSTRASRGEGSPSDAQDFALLRPRPNRDCTITFTHPAQSSPISTALSWTAPDLDPQHHRTTTCIDETNRDAPPEVSPRKPLTAFQRPSRRRTDRRTTSRTDRRTSRFLRALPIARIRTGTTPPPPPTPRNPDGVACAPVPTKRIGLPLKKPFAGNDFRDFTSRPTSAPEAHPRRTDRRTRPVFTPTASSSRTTWSAIAVAALQNRSRSVWSRAPSDADGHMIHETNRGTSPQAILLQRV